LTGPKYAASAGKRLLDLLVGFPAAIAALPIILVLVALNRALHPDLPAFFRQDRVGRQGTLRIFKIRSMLTPTGPHDPALTAFGRFIRRHKLDELPQVFQVLKGDLSLVGIRVLPREICEELRATWSPRRFERWRDAYTRSRLGLTGLHQVQRGVGKEDVRRFHRDVFYAERAWLGLDLYLLWRTARRIVTPPPRSRG
jgi:lipopolysaccharide/colanic/teichoic acid biosynthesis glycosyltransferase